MTLADNLESPALLQPNLSQSDNTLAPEQLICGKYKVISLISQGGMGAVYLVKQVFLNKEYALKTISSKNVSENHLRRFQAEAKMASTLSHPSLVQVHDFGVFEEGQPYLVMDYVDGITLAEYLKLHGPLPAEQAGPILVQACLGVFYAHSHRVVHRDLKPSNIMLVNGLGAGCAGSVRIVDFGIAKLANTDEGEIQALTRTGEIFGSPLYMSPEQCAGSNVDHRSDIYSLGCVLFEMLSGTPPHLGQNAMTTMMAHLSDSAPSLKQASLGKEFTESIERLVAKMLQKSPADRYQSLETVAYDLEKATADGAIPIIQDKSLKLYKRDETVTLRKRDLQKMIALTFIATAITTALLVHSLEGTSRSQISSTPSAPEVFSPEIAVANKVISQRITEGEKTYSELMADVNHPSPDGKLKLREVNLTSDILKEISKSKTIRNLDLVGCGVDNSSTQYLQNMTQLRLVSAIKTNLDDEGAAGLAQCSRLVRLKIGRTEVTDNGILALTRIKTLQSIDLSSTRVTDLCLQALSHLHYLRELDISNSAKVTNAGLKWLVPTSIQQLKLDNCNIDDRILQDLAKMRSLTEISLCRTRVTSAGLRDLLRSPSLKKVFIGDCPEIRTENLTALSRLNRAVQIFSTDSNDTVGISEMLMERK